MPTKGGGIVGASKIASGAVTTEKLADGAVTNVKVGAAAAIAYSKLALAASILKADLANGAIMRVIVPFWCDAASVASGATVFVPLGGATIASATEANRDTVLTGFAATLLEIHVTAVVQPATSGWEVAVRDDAADVAGSLVTTVAANAEVSATGLAAAIAAGSALALRIKNTGTAGAALQLFGFLVLDVNA